MNGRWRRVLTAAIALMVPRPFKTLLLNAMGHHVGRRARIGFGILAVERLWIADGARIGRLNFISCRRLVMRRGAVVAGMNVIRGPVSVSLGQDAGLGNRNVVARAPRPVSWGPARLRIGRGSKVTASHTIDCMRSVVIGEHSTIAGKGSQLWTHSYVHEAEGPGRVRVEGGITIGNNVYVGSACMISLGVTLGDGITLGSLTPVAKSLDQPGLYVAQPLRHLPRPFERAEEGGAVVPAGEVCERVVVRRGKG